MNSPSLERLIVVVCSGMQSLIFAVFVHSIMSNSQPIGLGYWLGLGSGLASFLAFSNLTTCAAFGANERVLKFCRFTTLLPLIIFGALFAIGSAY
ncbi:MAG: hypothetical protein RLY14_3093 [Planctomycetota bacterium]